MLTKALILSDTHRDIKTLSKILEKEKNYKYILHLGDHHTDLEETGFDFDDKIIYKVRGNCDFEYEEDDRIIIIDGIKIFMTHGHMYSVKTSISSLTYKAEEVGADIALFGHTHIAYNKMFKGIRYFNPGSLSRFRSYGKKRYASLIIKDNRQYSIITNEV